MSPEEERTKHRLRHDIQNTIEHGLRIRRNDVSTLRKSPRDWVQKPEEDGPDTADEVRTVDVRANHGGVLARGPGYRPGDPKESNAAEGVVAPLSHVSYIEALQRRKWGMYLVARSDKSANKTSNDHDFVNEESI